MGSATIRGRLLLIDDQPFYLRGGEVQYFRLPVSQWQDRLTKAVDGGLNTISSYMPWYWHEPQEGKVDLAGKTTPERDLRRYIELVAESGLKLVARPGPFVNSELRSGGMPEWLFRDHPETLSRRMDGEFVTGRVNPAEAEPLYRQYVRGWYRAVVPLIAEYDIHNGGPVILFQPDNELSAAWSYGLANSLYDPTILGKFWPDWLRETHKDIDCTSRRHEREYQRFEDVDPPRAFPQTAAEKRLCLDWMNFKRWFFSDWGATLASWAMEDGVKVPIIFNEPVAGFYTHGDHAGFGRILKDRGVEGVTVCHSYSPPLLDLEGLWSPVLGIELAKSSPWGGPPMSVEVNTTWYMPRLNRSAINWEPLLRLGLGHGLMGTVVYPYAAGTVRFEDVIDGPDYWNSACVDGEGRCSYLYRELQRFNRFLEIWEKELVSSGSVADVTIGYSPGLRLLDFLGAPKLVASAQADGPAGPGGESFDAEPALETESAAANEWFTGYEGVSRQSTPPEAGLWKRAKDLGLLLMRMSVPFDMLDLTNPNRRPGVGWILLPCTGSLDTPAIDYALEHIRSGGGCMFFPTIPVCDLDGKSDGRLAELLGIRLVDLIRPAGGQVNDYGSRVIDFGDGKRTGTYNWIFCHEFPPGSNILATHDGKDVIASLPSRRGEVVVAGMDAAFTTEIGIELWQTVFGDGMNAPRTITGKTDDCHVTLRRGEDASFLTVINITGTPGACEVAVDGLAFEVDLAAHEARCLLMGVTLNGRNLAYASSEIIPLNGKRSRLELWGRAGTRGELAFREPTTASLDGKEVRSAPRGNLHFIEYTHQVDPLVLSL